MAAPMEYQDSNYIVGDIPNLNQAGEVFHRLFSDLAKYHSLCFEEHRDHWLSPVYATDKEKWPPFLFETEQ